MTEARPPTSQRPARVRRASEGRPRAGIAESGRERSREELAARTGLPLEQVDSLFAIDRGPRSTDETVRTEDGDVGSFGELLADPLADGDYERVIGAIEEQELIALLACPSDRERSVLRAHYGLDDAFVGAGVEPRTNAVQFRLR